jgi:PAS domain S-box-containing protein
MGLGERSIVGRSFSEFTHPEDLARDMDLLDRLADGDLPYYQVQKRYLDAHADTAWCRVTVSEVAGERAHEAARFVAQVEDITEFCRAKELLERRALCDPLTGLANRALLIDRLAHALLAVVGQRVQGAVRAGDTVARLGGDEFVVVLENIATQAAAEAIAHRDVTAESLVRDADTAMYSAKQLGRARIEVFSSDLRESALNKFSIEAELRVAVRDGDLTVHYQPVVDLGTRAVVAYEALVRWQHPARRMLTPAEFIEIAEEANLVVPLGAFVLREACGFLARHPHFTGRMFVNVSTRQIGSADSTRPCTKRSRLRASMHDAFRSRSPSRGCS